LTSFTTYLQENSIHKECVKQSAKNLRILKPTGVFPEFCVLAEVFENNTTAFGNSMLIGLSLSEGTHRVLSSEW